MKPFIWTLISCLISTASAGPIPDSLKPYLDDRAVTVSNSDLSNFRFYVQYAAASYCNSDVTPGTTISCAENACPDVESAGAVVTATFAGEVADVQGFVSTDDKNKVIVASFRGSHSVRNWISNFIFTQTLCDITPGCLLHTGFYVGWQEVAVSVSAAVASAAAAHPNYRIVFTGHSLGAAIATIGAAYVRNAGYNVDIYGYGSPRVGNKEFVAYVTEQAGAEYRVTHLDDPVPRLPPILLNYRHTSPEYWLAGGTSNTTAYTVSDIKTCEGYANLACNSGTLGLDTEAHGYYLQEIAGCSPDDTPFKSRRDEDISDEDLEAQLNQYVVDDATFVATDLGGDVWA